MPNIRRKCFISYHKDDKEEVETFINTFDARHDVFIARAIGVVSQDIIDSNNTDYVMRRIRELYLKDSTVTIVLLGKCTWSRRFVDWEIQSSIRSGDSTTPNGLLGIKLPSYNSNGYPDRLNKNLKQTDTQVDCYARVYSYPNNTNSLSSWIEDAFNARTARKHLIVNPRERFSNNRSC